MEYMWAIWLGIFVIALIIEASTSELVSIFFATGSIVALIISFIPGVEWWVQLIVFVVISGASLLALRPLVKKYLNKEKRSTNVDALVGKKITVSDVNDLGYQEAKINGLPWTVEAVDEKQKINVGDEVVVVSIRGNTLIVKKEGK